MSTLHELTHGLGFSSYYFPKFIDENGNLRKNPVISFPAANGQQQQGLATPNVLAYARQFYGCDSWSVVPLENDGDNPGTAGSHFERSFYFNEVMTGNIFFNEKAYSAFTWSVLADSGWYGIDLKNADVFSAG